MARIKNPEIRTALLERAAYMLRERESITLRSLVAGTGTSTMAVYTYFGGLPGLWSAVRQEGFTRLADVLDDVAPTADPVHDLAALGAAYVRNAVDNPDLYRLMFDATFDLVDPRAADATLQYLVAGVERGIDDGRFRTDTDPQELAVRSWLVGHGAASLVATGPLPAAALDHIVPLLAALYVSVGDDPERCRASLNAGWTSVQRRR